MCNEKPKVRQPAPPTSIPKIAPPPPLTEPRPEPSKPFRPYGPWKKKG